MNITPIETTYAGCRFRSRLEARWAVFFDELNVEWRYEPEGFRIELSSGRRINYLPDFYLPESGTWVEVKGDFARFDKELLAAMTDGNNPLPGMFDSLKTKRGLILLGNVPPVEKDGPTPIHPILQHHEGGYVNDAWWGWSTKKKSGSLNVTQPDAERVFDGYTGPESLDENDCWDYIKKFWAPYRPMVWNGKDWEGDGTPPMWWGGECDARIAKAYQRARQARFEHGQKG